MTTWRDRISGFDVAMTVVEPVLRRSRELVCGRAHGHTLEVAIGSGLNLPRYPPGVALTAIEIDRRLAAQARRRAARLGRPVEVVVGDAMALPFPDTAFDTVVCTFALCGITRDDVALTEMVRVLKPGGDLLLADHVRSPARPVLALQRALDAVTIPLAGEHWTRRPLEVLTGLDLDIIATATRAVGVLECIHARRRPLAAPDPTPWIRGRKDAPVDDPTSADHF